MSVMLRMGGTQVGDDGIPRGAVVPYADPAGSLMSFRKIQNKVIRLYFDEYNYMYTIFKI
jgi:hypothetical protein